MEDFNDQTKALAFAAALEKAGLPPMAFTPDIVEMFLSTLEERDRKIFELRYGLGESPPMTLAKVGEVFGLSGSRIGAINEKIFRKIKWIAKAYDAQNPEVLRDMFSRRLMEIIEWREKRAEIAQATLRAEEEKKTLREARRERRRAKDRKRMWDRKVQQADLAQRNATAAIARLDGKMSKLEGRSAIMRRILPMKSTIIDLSTKLATARQALADAVDAKARLLSSPPDGPNDNLVMDDVRIGQDGTERRLRA